MKARGALLLLYVDDLRVSAATTADILTRASTGGHVVMIGNCPVVWKAKKQVLVTLSSTEAEFINLTPTALSLL